MVKKNIAGKLSLNNSDDLYAALGYGSVTLAQVIPRLKELHKEHYKIRDEKKLFLKIKQKKSILSKKRQRRLTQGISIEGLDNIKVRFSKCCNPVPGGDEIIGYITRGRGGFLFIERIALMCPMQMLRKDL